MKNFFRNLKIGFFSFLLLAALLASCDISEIADDYDLPVKAYLEEASSTPYFSGYTLSVSAATDSAGYRCVGSAEALVITFSISNPRNLALKVEYSFPENSGATASSSGTTDSSSSSGTSGTSGTSSSSNSSSSGTSGTTGNTTLELSGNSAILIIPKDVLSDIDGDTDKFDISPTVNLFTVEDGAAKQVDSKSIPLRCNTVPTAVSNAMTMMYSNDNILVVCLELPSEDKDAKYISVYGHTFDIESSQASSGGWTLSSSKPENLNPTADGYEYSAKNGGTSYYVMTDISDLLNKSLFTIGISVTDKGGLSSSTHSIPSRVAKASKPVLYHDSAEVSSGSFEQDSGQDYATFTLSSSSSGTISYILTDSSGNEIANSSGSSPIYLELYPSEDGSEATYSLTATASSANTLESDELSVSFTVKSRPLTLESSAGDSNTIKVSTADDDDGNAATYTYKLTPSEDATLDYEIKKDGNSFSSGSDVSITADKGFSLALSEETYSVSATLKKSYHESVGIVQTITVTVPENSGEVTITTPADLAFSAALSDSKYIITATSGNVDVTESVTSWTIKVLDSSGSDVTTAAGFTVNANTVKLPTSLHSDSYTISIVAVYNETSYSGTYSFTQN